MDEAVRLQRQRQCAMCDDYDHALEKIRSMTMTMTTPTKTMTIMMIMTMAMAMALFFLSQLRSDCRTVRKSCNPGAGAPVPASTPGFWSGVRAQGVLSAYERVACTFYHSIGVIDVKASVQARGLGTHIRSCCFCDRNAYHRHPLTMLPL